MKRTTDHIADAGRALTESAELLRAAERAQNDAVAALRAASETAIETTVQGGVEEFPPATDHRRHHRPGRPPKIDTDPELQAFIRARIDSLTFVQVADAVAEAFPPARRVGKSAIHAWWTRNRDSLASSGNPPR